MAGNCNIAVGILLFMSAFAFGYELKQVLILSRHNIRAPLSSNLNYLSNKPWPKWTVEPGFLTEKGALLEGFIANYISNWLVNKGLLSSECPYSKSVHIYSNTVQRTRETAQAFVEGAFNNCNITVYSKNSTKMDPIFNPIIRNKSQELKSMILNEMQQKLDNLNFTNAYLKLNEIVDLRHAKICRADHVCDFTKAKDEIVYRTGEEPNISGPLAYTTSIVDAFMMSYYEGMQMHDVAWGHMEYPKEWKLFTQIMRGHLDVRFNSPSIGKEVAKPLLQYVYNILTKNDSPKFTLLVGHDSNLNSVMAALGFKPYVLPDQDELTPLGGKLVFQKWYDSKNNKIFLKTEYIYQTVSQLRNSEILSESNPPRIVTMEIKNCDVDAEGFCLWDDFMSILKSSFQS